MAFTNGKEFQRQLKFMRERVLDKFKEAVRFRQERFPDGYTLDNPVKFTSPGMINIGQAILKVNRDGTVTAGAPEGDLFKGFDTSKMKPFTKKLEEIETEVLVNILAELESTQWNTVKAELDT